MTYIRPPMPRRQAWHRQVADAIRDDIATGVLADGQVLPSTRELAAQFGTSVFTISQAMKLLQDEGLVVSWSRSRRAVRTAGLTEGGPADLRSRQGWRLISIVAPPEQADAVIAFLHERGMRNALEHTMPTGPHGVYLSEDVLEREWPS